MKSKKHCSVKKRIGLQHLVAPVCSCDWWRAAIREITVVTDEYMCWHKHYYRASFLKMWVDVNTSQVGPGEGVTSNTICFILEVADILFFLSKSDKHGFRACSAEVLVYKPALHWVRARCGHFPSLYQEVCYKQMPFSSQTLTALSLTLINKTFCEHASSYGQIWPCYRQCNLGYNINIGKMWLSLFSEHLLECSSSSINLQPQCLAEV